MNIDDIKYDEKGLVPAITQDAVTGEILMFAWMNSESLGKTLETGIMTYWSRSRQKLWTKGETSGYFQVVQEIYVDCDADCLLFKVTPQGDGAACHDGFRSCFYRKIDLSGEFFEVGERIFLPEEK